MSKQLDEGIADTLVSDGAPNDSCLLVLSNFAMRESVRSFYLTCTYVSAFLCSLVEEISEIAGQVIQWSATAAERRNRKLEQIAGKVMGIMGAKSLRSRRFQTRSMVKPNSPLRAWR